MKKKTSSLNAIGIVFSSVLSIALCAILIIWALTIILPNSVTKDHYFNSVKKLSNLAVQTQDTKVLQSNISSDLKNLHDLRNNPKKPDPNQPQLYITSTDIAGVLRTLEQSQAALKNVDLYQDKLKKAISTLEEDSEEVDDILNTMPLVNGEWISQLVIGILWICLASVFLIYLFISPAALRIISFLLSIFRSFKGFGFELSVSDRKAQNEEMHKTFKKVFSELRDQFKYELRRFCKSSGLEYNFSIAAKQIFNEIRTITNKTDLNDLRCTIHAPDLLFEQFLCQIINYEPRGAGAGRAWSIFYGIIGRVWRSSEPDHLHLNHTAIDGTDEANREAKRIIKEYGMTIEQIRNTVDRKMSFMCIPIKDNGGVIRGVFYMDTTVPIAFGNEENILELKNKIPEHLNQLVDHLSKYHMEYTEPLVQIIGA